MERRNPKVLAQILDATFECLARQGSMSISLREIAKHAGVALSQLHYYFDSKENLLAEAVLYKTRKIIQELRSELHTAPSLEERIHQFGQFLRSDRVLGSDWQKVYFDLLSSSIWVPRMAEAMRSVQEEMLQVVLADDQLRIMNRSEARLILAALDGLALQYLQGAPDEELQTAYELLGKALIRLRG
ncbi:TetR family transcriptional regulator [Alicyclobacillus cycloheptanicus]|uniref:AcrR family transcriptional regulator n=1 Tax=Alicyclobacillus cycloheptanicus TaxID=1457 RepID=A0ABT9XG24_9BACL|nr:TetR/AcrR family transcriptional regulator [Alicyclobacillus cycloheptanicus]MDQ0189080.1 AcrR family transcriptional regulator [Alicyclobacillus cycloheptanicus]WDM00214.1 TetR family transcriptional regulator [Alicyclobacillus cycloheptanicus]